MNSRTAGTLAEMKASANSNENPTGSPIRLLIVDDHPLIREGIAALLSDKPDLELVAQAASGAEGVEQFRKHKPDITLMDLQMPGLHGIDAIIAIREEHPEAVIIVLTTYSGDVQVRRALKAGAHAYLLKDLLHQDLLSTIRSVHGGQRAFSPAIAADLSDHLTDDLLTDREMEVLELIAKGHANKQIGASLAISEEAVKSRVKSFEIGRRSGLQNSWRPTHRSHRPEHESSVRVLHGSARWHLGHARWRLPR
jgi:DNA-binding NarL/FixJ family response regulator